MNAIRRALDARWVLLVITAALVLMTGTTYWHRSTMEWTPSLADQQRALRAQQKIRTLVPGDIGTAMATYMASENEMRVSYAELFYVARNCLTFLSCLGIIGCLVNLWPLRRPVLTAAQPAVEADDASPRR
jgi:hypothetical protein